MRLSLKLPTVHNYRKTTLSIYLDVFDRPLGCSLPPTQQLNPLEDFYEDYGPFKSDDMIFF